MRAIVNRQHAHGTWTRAPRRGRRAGPAHRRRASLSFSPSVLPA